MMDRTRTIRETLLRKVKIVSEIPGRKKQFFGQPKAGRGKARSQIRPFVLSRIVRVMYQNNQTRKKHQTTAKNLPDQYNALDDVL